MKLIRDYNMNSFQNLRQKGRQFVSLSCLLLRKVTFQFGLSQILSVTQYKILKIQIFKKIRIMNKIDSLSERGQENQEI